MPTPVDAHVHVYPSFDADALLDAAREHFLRARGTPPPDSEPLGVLMLTETRRDDVFTPWRSGSRESQPRRWSVRPTDEACSLSVTDAAGRQLVIIAGRQIVTAERLEVHAIGTTSRFDDGEPIDHVLDRLTGQPVITVLPWGVGKWTGARGRTIERLLEGDWPADRYVGDNSGRPRGTPTPRLLHNAESRGIRIVPGSDPLPLPDHERHAGRFGFLTDTPASDRPFEAIRRWLRDAPNPLPRYGRRAGPIECLTSQLAMQMRNRLGRGGATPARPTTATTKPNG